MVPSTILLDNVPDCLGGGVSLDASNQVVYRILTGKRDSVSVEHTLL